MVFKAAINQSYAMLCHPKDLRNHCAKACTHSPYNLLGLGIRGYGKEVSIAKWWERTTPANHCQVEGISMENYLLAQELNSCRVCHKKLFHVTCMITTDDNLTENFTIPDVIETSSNNKLFNGDHKRQTAVCGYWFHDICLPIFRKQDSRVVACGCHVCFYSFVHFYYSWEIVFKVTFLWKIVQ